jgi:hypothetical protein
MSNRAFTLLYLLCLALCVSAVQGARAARASIAAAPAIEIEQRVAVAIPPKPETELDRQASEPGAEGTHYDEATCDKYQGDFRDVCYHALARQRAARDLQGALLACEVVERRRLRWECQADVAELHVGTDLTAARAVCPTISARKWRDQCSFGIAMALVSTAPREALAGCDDAGIWRDFCRHDVLGEVSVFDLELVLEVCGREQGDLLTRKTCWHGIGKYIGRVDLPRAFSACERVPLGPSNLYRENCVHGAGWAAGERFGDAGLSHCSAAGTLEDSCRLGVAFQIERSQPERAVDICRSVGRLDLRDHCLAWLSR